VFATYLHSILVTNRWNTPNPLKRRARSQHTLRDTDANPKRPCDLSLSHAGRGKITDALFHFGIGSWPTQLLALGARAFETSFDSFLNYRSLKLRENSAHLKHRFPRRRRRVQCLPMQVQIDALCLKLHQEFNEVQQASPQTVDGPRCNHVEVAPRNALKQRVELRALGSPLSTAYPLIYVLPNDGPPMAIGNGSEL
jgi:hypothetical protein